MWDREFPSIAAEPALLRGYHRRFCLYSYDYRGTRTRPGLTLGLDRGGACRGIVLRLPPETLAEGDRYSVVARDDGAPGLRHAEPAGADCYAAACGHLPSRYGAITRIMPGG